MSNKHNTPISPAEALSRFPPIGAYANTQVNAPIRQGKTIWCIDEDCWLVEDKRTVARTGPRSTSSSAVPRVVHAANSIKVQQVLLRERPQLRRSAVSARLQFQTSAPYSQVQIASFRHYREKLKRLSSQEYGNDTKSVHFQHTQSRSLDSGQSRIVDLEFVDALPAQQAKSRYDRASPQRPRPPLSKTRSLIPSTSSDNLPRTITIARKPVGSAPSIPKASRSTSDSIMCWQLPQKVRRPISPPLTSEEDEKHDELLPSPSSSPVDLLGSPWDDQTLPPSPSPPQRSPSKTKGLHNRFIRKEHFLKNVNASREGRRVRRPEHNSRSTSSSSAQSSSGPTLPSDDEVEPDAALGDHRDGPIFDATGFFILCLRHVETTVTTENWRKVRGWILWISKSLLVVYLAACIWGILAAVKDAIVSACAPILVIWAFLSWVFRN